MSISTRNLEIRSRRLFRDQLPSACSRLHHPQAGRHFLGTLHCGFQDSGGMVSRILIHYLVSSNQVIVDKIVLTLFPPWLLRRGYKTRNYMAPALSLRILRRIQRRSQGADARFTHLELRMDEEEVRMEEMVDEVGFNECVGETETAYERSKIERKKSVEFVRSICLCAYSMHILLTFDRFVCSDSWRTGYRRKSTFARGMKKKLGARPLKWVLIRIIFWGCNPWMYSYLVTSSID